MGSFAISTTSSNDITGRIEWSESNVSIANNTSDLNVKLIYRMNNSYYATYGSGYFKITVNGTAYENNHYVTFASGTHEYTVIDHTFTITHDANGAKSVSIVLNNGYVAGTTGLSASSGSGTATLTTIARASQPSTTNGTFGSAITINTNRASSSFTHTLTMTMGSHSETKTGVGASLSWTIPASWADTIPTATSNTLSISCVTYNGSTNIGTKTTSCTATIPDSWKPSVSISKTLTNGGDNSQVIANVTTVNLSASGTASTGTSISSYSWSGGAVSGTGASKTHSPTTVATFTYTVTVTDRRGRTGSASVTATSESGISSMSCNSSVNFGSALAVTITRKKASFTHNVTWQISSSYTNTATGQGTSASYTIPTSWAASVPAASSINMTVTVTTYNGNTSLGSVNKTVSVVVPSSWTPDFTLTAESVSGFNSQYLLGQSKVKLTASSASPSTGSQIQSYQFTGNNVNKTATTTATSYNVTSDVLGTQGTNTYTVKVTDKRGRVKTKTVSITVVYYRAPIIYVSVGRYTSGGVADNFGGYARASVSGSWSSVTGNKWTLTIKQKKKTASSYTTVNTWSDQTGNINQTSSLFTADVDSTYDVQATITDAVGNTMTKNAAVSTGKAIRDLFKDKVVSFFSTANDALRSIFLNPATLFYVGADKVAFNGRIKIPDKVSNDGMTTGWFAANQLSSALLASTIDGERLLQDNTDFNDLSVPGSYFINGIVHAQTMSNMPFGNQTAGTLYVRALNGEYYSQGTWQYYEQEFRPYNSTPYYYKRYGESGDTPTVTWSPWRRVDLLVDGNFDTSVKLLPAAPKILFNDSAGYEATFISYNGSNIWIGSQSSSNYQFRGQTYISAGRNDTNGNPTIYIAVPNANNSANYYGAHHDNRRLHLRLFLGNTVLSGNGTVQFTDSTKSADFLFIIGRSNETSTYGTSWSSAILPTGKYSGSNWTDNSEMTMLMGGGTNFPIKVNRSGDTYTLTRYGSSAARYYVWGFCNP